MHMAHGSMQFFFSLSLFLFVLFVLYVIRGTAALYHCKLVTKGPWPWARMYISVSALSSTSFVPVAIAMCLQPESGTQGKVTAVTPGIAYKSCTCPKPCPEVCFEMRVIMYTSIWRMFGGNTLVPVAKTKKVSRTLEGTRVLLFGNLTFVHGFIITPL